MVVDLTKDTMEWSFRRLAIKRLMVILLPFVSWLGFNYLFTSKQDSVLNDGCSEDDKLERCYLLENVKDDNDTDKFKDRNHLPDKYNEMFWEEVRRSATKEHLYSSEVDVKRIILALASAKIVRVRLFSPDQVDESEGIYDFGSTHKWLIDLEGGQRAIFKPKW